MSVRRLTLHLYGAFFAGGFLGSALTAMAVRAYTTAVITISAALAVALAFLLDVVLLIRREVTR